MWRILAIHLRTVTPFRSASRLVRCAAGSPTAPVNVVRPFTSFFSHFSSGSGNASPKRIEDIMPIATGHEREELDAELRGRDILEINHPVGPFGTKEAPAVVKSYYDKRIFGCPGGEGEDEHDVVWFWLEKGKPYECPVCSQCFVLEVVGPGGSPDGHDDEEGGHHY